MSRPAAAVLSGLLILALGLGGCGRGAPGERRTVTALAPASATTVTVPAPASPTTLPVPAPASTTTVTVPAPAPTTDLHLTGSTLPPGVLYDRRAAGALRDRAESYLVGGWRDPVNAVRAFAFVYGNWTASTVALHMRMLSYLTVGQARSLVTLQAAQTAADGDLQRGGIANTATLEAVAPLPGPAGRYIVVTRERTRSSETDAYQGLPAAWHVTLATVARIPEGLWVVSGWQAKS